ncbi:unnamed protein product [Mytilus coruscus]|uniref:Uncharacterized protein n=1 Tax=Mytilus coruscus TaxID=42192 RepID=A0A6J8C9R8_MYTCO|nr:unnamed protein product [Mytilus coruscus]
MSAFNSCLYASTKWSTPFKKNAFNDYLNYRCDQYSLSKAVDRCEPHINKHLLEKLQTTVKKGIWVYGPPGTGKSCTVLWFTQGNHYEIPQVINQFVLDTWERQKYILCDDLNAPSAERMRGMINQLTDDRGLCQGERKGGRKFLVEIDKFIVTSNDAPPTWVGFERRFEVIYLEGPTQLSQEQYVPSGVDRSPDNSAVQNTLSLL